MINSFLKLFALLMLTIIMVSADDSIQSSENEDIVKSFIEARNSYEVEKINSFVEEDYRETFADGSVEIENRTQLMGMILWGKAMDARIELLEISADDKKVLTIEEYTNYLDLALKRKSRRFKVTYSLLDNKIQHQKIDTLPGYHQIMQHNWERYQEFENYCKERNLKSHFRNMDGESGMQLRKVLEKYIGDNE